MSTRANVILKEIYKDSFGHTKVNELFFYRHSDGYPEGTLPSLNILIKWLKESKLRNNLSQSAGWLIIIGAIEYNTIPKFETKKDNPLYGDLSKIDKTNNRPYDGWKCGSYEPTTEIHGDIEYLYEIDVTKMKLTYHKVY